MKLLVVIDGLGIGNVDEQEGTLQAVFPHIYNKTKDKSSTLNRLIQTIENPTHTNYLSLGYEGADSYLGHFEMMGISAYFNKVFLEQHRNDILNTFGEGNFTDWGYYNDQIALSNNIEAELGSSINLITSLSNYKSIQEKAKKFRKLVDANRLIVMASNNVISNNPAWLASGLSKRHHSDENVNNVEVCGLIPARLDMYNNNYICNHIGRGFSEYHPNDQKNSYLYQLMDTNTDFCMIGKVCDIFQLQPSSCNLSLINNISASDVADSLRTVIEKREHEFVLANFQTFDLLCHSRDVNAAAQELEKIATYLDEIIALIKPKDSLIITADHGNNPLAPGNSHTRENVPIIIHGLLNSKILQMNSLRDINDILKL